MKRLLGLFFIPFLMQGLNNSSHAQEYLIPSINISVPSYCELENTKEVNFNIDDFHVEQELLNHIIEEGLYYQINPLTVISLIAQESSFKAHAVSHSNAIGLTQITDRARDEIEKMGDFPNSRKLSHLSPGYISELIDAGILTDQYDWRLNPKHSVTGGIYYLKYLQGYWNKKKDFLKAQGLYNKKDLTLITLASYNSGASRVYRAIQKHNHRWLSSPKLKEAKYYVLQINNYCVDFFASI